MCTYMHPLTHTHPITCTRTLSHTTCLHTRSHTFTPTRTHMHTPIHIHMHTPALTHLLTHMHTPARVHMYTCSQTHSQTHKHTRTHLLTNACRSHTHMHTPTLTHCRHPDQGRKQSLLEECHRHSQSGLFLPLSTMRTRVTERRARKVTSSAHAPWGWRVSIQPTQPSAGPFDRERGGYRSSRHRPAGSAATMLP